MASHVCKVNGSSMTVSGDFGNEGTTDLDAACQQLLTSPGKALLVDAVGMTSICSTYVGLLAELCLGAKNSGRQLTIRADGRIANVLDAAGLGSVARIERCG
jgi:ABC-type transporter Mla MlaB component